MVEARAAGLDVIALTDHDSTGGHAEALAALPAGLTLVSGAEISCRADGISLHLLAYLFDPAEPAFQAARSALRDSRSTRAERMVESLAEAGTGVTWEQVQALAGGAVGRPHIAQALIAQGLIDSVGEAFTPEWLGNRGPHFRDKLELDAVEAVRLVVAAGGVAVFAHPRATKRGRTVSDQVIVDLAEAGLAGLEVDHPDHDGDERAQLRGLARELELFVTGSSDFHGGNKPVELGAETTSEAAYEQLLAAASGASPLSG
ncbi:MAG: C-terminal protein [Frankiales bacterium]|nr:C-terminal protein [Frankiales bacterium]